MNASHHPYSYTSVVAQSRYNPRYLEKTKGRLKSDSKLDNPK